VAEQEPVTGRRWRGIEELAGLVGAYCWVEWRIFQLAGAWASRPNGAAGAASGAEVRIWCAAASRRHGALAGRWAERLPARAGVDTTGAVMPPAGPLAEALDALAAEPDTVVGATVLVEAALPRLVAAYEGHLRTASPVSEAPVMEVLAGARWQLAGEIRAGRFLLQGSPQARERGGALGQRLERAFAGTGVFPAVRPS
jgi:hypothetical protein